MAQASGPSWTLTGFHARVRIAKDFHLFIVTEGEEADAYFYDQLARSSILSDVQAVKVYPVAQITRPQGSLVGLGLSGKPSVIDAYAATKQAGALSASNSGGKRAIVFCVDRDLTNTHEVHEGDEHFIVTHNRDVEAEIFQNADPVSAVQHIVSKDRHDAAQLVNELGPWKVELARRWRDWIVLSAVAIRMPSAPPNVAWGDVSLINEKPFGPVDLALRQIFEDKLIAKLGSKRQLELKKTEARRNIRELQSARGQGSVVKGKWYPRYLEESLQPLCGTKKGRISGYALVAFSATLIYEGEWARRYVDKFDALFQ